LEFEVWIGEIEIFGDWFKDFGFDIQYYPSPADEEWQLRFGPKNWPPDSANRAVDTVSKIVIGDEVEKTPGIF
jgi:hypothetical protein